MKVVCSGFPKTGTKSLATALRVLGNKVFDFEEQYFYLGEEFMRFCEQGWTTDDIRNLYKDADVVTNVQGNLFWEKILKAYPDVKVRLEKQKNCYSWLVLFHSKNIKYTI